MKVLLIHDKNVPVPTQGRDAPSEAAMGGIAVILAEASAALERRGWSVSMIRLTSSPRAHAETTGPHYELTPPGNRIRPALRRQFRQIVEAEDPDIVHVYSVHSAVNPGMVSRLSRRWPVVSTLQDVTPICYWRKKLHPDGRLCEVAVGLRCITRGCYRLGAQYGFARDLWHLLTDRRWLNVYRRLPLIVPSGYLKEQLVVNGFLAERIRVIPNFSRFAGRTVRPDSRETGKQILFVGRLIKEKGVEPLLQALSKLKTKDWQATIVGDGDRLDWARAWCTSNSLADRIRFAGGLGADRLEQFYQTCRLLVVPSLIPESFGMVGVEAMTFGKPVVAFASGGVTEWLKDGANGFLVEHGNSDELARRIDLLLSDDDLCRRLGANGYETVQARFRLDHHVDHTVALYEDAMRAFHA
jgi:glycosyltransferase involved in cell wall biosynthesis